MNAPAAAVPLPRLARLAGMLNDPRDLPFLGLMAEMTFFILPFAAVLYVPGVFRWWLAAIYVVFLGLQFIDRFVLMLHNTSHRPLFKRRWHLLNHYIPWVLGPFVGETPETYFAHHVGMHHLENNLADDLSSTMPYRRDHWFDFLKYYGRFMFLGLPNLAGYLRAHKRGKLRTKLLVGELSYFAVVAGLLVLNWRATVVVFVFPLLLVRFLMLCGNWGQHAFVDPAAPHIPFLNSTIVLNERYNRRCFNDGYHIGHHVKASRHWSEMPGEFAANRATYAKEGAIVLRGVDYNGLWWLLMLRRYRKLAELYVPLAEPAPSEAEIIALLKHRAQAIHLSPQGGWMTA